MVKKLVQQNDLTSGLNNLLSSQIFKYSNVQLKEKKQIFLNVICAIEEYLFHGKHSKRSIVLHRYDENISDKNYFKFC